jgi:DNA polymerase-3 subunit delta'
MRELMQTIQLKPYEAAVKASVIVAADRLNVQAANAFLKTLEEPPARSVIILLSTEPQRVMETILSRCLRLNFAGTSHLNLSGEDKQWINDFANAAAATGEGLLSRYRLLSVLLERLSSIKELTEKELTARSPLEKYDDVDSRVKEKWEVELTAAIEAEYRHRRAGVLAVLQWWLRDVWLLTFGSKENGMFPDLQPVSETVAVRIASKDALHNIEVVEKTQRLLRSNIQEALALEVGLLKLRF